MVPAHQHGDGGKDDDGARNSVSMAQNGEHGRAEDTADDVIAVSKVPSTKGTTDTDAPSKEPAVGVHSVSVDSASPAQRSARVSTDEKPTATYPDPLGSEDHGVVEPPKRTTPLTRFLQRIFRSPPIPTERRESGQYGAGILARVFFTWPTHAIWAAGTRGLDMLDIEHIDKRRKVTVKRAIFLAKFDALMARNAHFALWRAIFSTYRPQLIGVMITSLINTHMIIFGCLLFWKFGMYLQDSWDRAEGKNTTMWFGVLLSLAIALLIEVYVIIFNHSLYLASLVAGEVRTLLGVLMYEKALRISPTALRPRSKQPTKAKETGDLAALLALGQETDNDDDERHKYWTSGEILNSMTVDTKRVEDAIARAPFAFPLIPAIPSLLVVSWILFDWPGIVCSILVLCTLPFSLMVGSMINKHRENINKLVDVRTNIVMDMIRGVRFLKIFGWENIILGRLKKVRKGEAKRLMVIQLATYVGWLMAFVMQRVPVVVAGLLYSHFFDLEKTYNYVAYATLVYRFGDNLYMTMLYTPIYTLAIPSTRNIQQYLSAEERGVPKYLKTDTSADAAISFDNASFSWHSEEVRKTLRHEDHQAQFVLAPISLTVGRGELVAVVGPVGAGKSSVAAALVGQLESMGGSVTLSVPLTSVAYCAQAAWIQNASVRENITFGLPFDETRYNAIIDVTALRRDIRDEFPDGDATELGERGFTISGGQKARVQLARTLYRGMDVGTPRDKDCDIFILDDPLSAVDAHTSKIIFQKAIVEGLSNKCRVLVTHQLQYIQRCDRVVWIDDGKVRDVGRYQELVDKHPGFARFVDDCAQEEEENDRTPGDKNAAQVQGGDSKDAHKPAVAPARAIDDETRAVKPVPWSLYKTYNLLGAPWWVTVLLFSNLVLSQVFQSAVTLCVAWWTDREWNLADWVFAVMFIAFIAGHLVTWGTHYVGITDIYINASRKISTRALDSVFRAPQSFFDKTPIGRIINRFTNDLNYTDTILPQSYWWITVGIINMMSLLGLMISYVYLSAAIFVPWLVLFILILIFYKEAPLELRRLEALYDSYYVTGLEEGISGRPTLVACGRQEDFSKALYRTVDELNSIHFMGFASQAWVSSWGANMNASLTFLVGIVCASVRFDQAPGVTLLVLTTCPTISVFVQYMLDEMVNMQRGMNAVERINEYRLDLPREGARNIEGAVSDSWPHSGAIEIENAHMRYGPTLPLTLRGLNVSIKPGEKVGIVGRTGAGKSSLLAVLLRMVNLEEGSIKIDGVDIAHIGLHDLRQRVAVIPQDPTLFLGTVRYNLDPEADEADEANNARLEAALRAVSLIRDESEKEPLLEKTPSVQNKERTHLTLSSPVASEGANFSHGDKQLMALARALVKNSKVIVIDEATSSVDPRTDARIQRTMLRQFAHATVLAIAHRIRTVIRYDKICVLDKGQVVEFGSPAELWRRGEGGMFRGFCDAAGIREEQL